MMMIRNKFLKRPFLTVFFLLVHTSCATTTGPIVTSQEVTQYESVLRSKAAHFKATQTKRVQAIAERIIQFMPPEERGKLTGLHYEVSDSSDINAGVQPGKIVVNYGMLRFTESDDELAAVIGHELAHVIKGHYAKKLVTNVVSTALGVAAGIALESLTQGSGIGTPVAKGIAAGVGGGFSRELEREADYFGFQYVYLAGFDMANGAKIWERMAIEAPQTMTGNLFSTHPPSPERVIRAEKTLAELRAQGIQPHLFNRPSGTFPSSREGMVAKTLSIPARAVTSPLSVATSALTRPLPFAGSAGSKSNPSTLEPENPQGSLTEEEKELMALREEVKRLRSQEEARLKELAQDQAEQAAKEAELERILLEAKEVAKQLRYAEFGIQDIGLAKKVTNLWIGKKVSGEQVIFPMSQGRLDWFVQYNYWSAGSWKALALQHRKYRAYWYAPSGRLFSEQDFVQSKVRAEFAKTTFQWDPALGNFLVGKWLVRIFQDGKLLDERTFEIV